MWPTDCQKVREAQLKGSEAKIISFDFIHVTTIISQVPSSGLITFNRWCAWVLLECRVPIPVDLCHETKCQQYLPPANASSGGIELALALADCEAGEVN